MDAQPAELTVEQGGVKLVGQGLNQQRYGIALPKGAPTLKAQIDQVLTDLTTRALSPNWPRATWIWKSIAAHAYARPPPAARRTAAAPASMAWRLCNT